MNQVELMAFIDKHFPEESQKFGFSGRWAVVCRDKVTKKIKWKEYTVNLITNETLNDVLDVYLSNSGGASAAWYCLLFSSDSTPAAGWTYANIGTDFTEFTSYDESNRPTWTEAGVSSQQITNTASPATFTASAAVSTTIYGAGMVNVNTKGDNSSPSGILFCATRFGTARPFNEGEEINIVYTVSASSA